MNLEKPSPLAARFIINEVTPSEIVEWAITSLQQGISTPTLPVVAGYTSTELAGSLQNFRTDVTKVFHELGLTIPSEKEAQIIFACYLCEGILNKSIPEDAGLLKLYELWRNANYHPELSSDINLRPFMYITNSLENIEIGEISLIKGLTKDNYSDHLRQECINYLAVEKNLTESL